MRDDVMGAFGDEAVTGKPVGGDLREGKPTPLLARAVAAASPAQAAVLDRVGAADLTDAEVADIQQAIIDTGALAALEAHIESLTRAAIDALDAVAIAQEARTELVALAEYVSWRQT
jgi:geranylgeranyl diphosphate synthase, type I